MANVLVGVTGSVAAIYTPQLYGDLIAAGYAAKVVATRPSLYFFEPGLIATTGDETRNRNVVILDEDEWPTDRYMRGDPVLHVELRRWADVFLIAPCDANTLAKLALGITDNCLTCVYRAWDLSRPVVIAPAMNTLMWEHPVTARHIRQIALDHGTAELPPNGELLEQIAWLNDLPIPLRIAPPVVKALACDDVGIGAMAGRAELLAMVAQFF
jgi:phosphopantothenoylcysteine decarboxylase